MPETVFGCGISVDSPTPDGGAIRAGRGSEMQSTTRQRALRVFGVAAITVSMISYAPGVSASSGNGNVAASLTAVSGHIQHKHWN